MATSRSLAPRHWIGIVAIAAAVYLVAEKSGLKHKLNL